MNYFLVEHSSLDIKKAVCHHLIDRLRKKPEDQAFSDQVGQVLNELIPPLLFLYHQSPDSQLRLYACLAL